MIGKKKVVHVVESYGGGVRSAICDYVRATPEISHELLYASRADSPISDEDLQLFSRTFGFHDGFRRRIEDIRKVCANADVIHAHSSLAGLYVRLSLPKHRDSTVIYTPHAFAFERQDIGTVRRAMFWTAEAILARNTDVIAGCSPREVALASSFHSRKTRVCFLPNVASLRRGSTSNLQSPGNVTRIVAIGRNAPQKDPAFFFHVFEAFRRNHPRTVNVEWLWIGGDEDLRSKAPPSVTVTGWMGREQTLDLLATCDIYVHSALWEGFPITLLEAVEAGLVPVVRYNSSFQDVALPFIAKTPEQIADLIQGLISVPARLAGVESAQNALAPFSRPRQRAALLDLYPSKPNT